MTIFARIGAFYERRRTAVLVGGIGLFYLINNLVWLGRDTLPPSWDQAAHADHCLTYFRLFGEPMRLSLTKLLTVSSYYPPFFYVSTVPWSFLFGFSTAVLALSEIVFLLVLVFAVIKIGDRLFSPAVGTGAAVLIALCPVVYGLSREILLDLPVIAMVALTQYAILETRAGTDRKKSWALGLALGLAVLIKWTAIVFVAGSFLVVFAGEIKRRRPPAGKVLASLAIALFVALIVALPWYAANSASIASGAAHSLSSDALREGDPSALGLSLRWYWRALAGAPRLAAPRDLRAPGPGGLHPSRPEKGRSPGLSPGLGPARLPRLPRPSEQGRPVHRSASRGAGSSWRRRASTP